MIRTDLGASLEDLEWTVNAYTLVFAVLLLTGAALGDRFGRRRMFSIGLGIFTLGSVAAALAPSVDALNIARATQGLGGAIVMPLTLTLLSAAVPAEKRGLALGAWGGIGGLAIAFGPLVGGAVVEGIAWQWIFWLNVPIGVLLVPIAMRRLEESHGPAGRLDLPGVALASAGLFGIVWGLVRGNGAGWASAEILGSLGAGLLLVAAFVVWELRAPAPMLPMRFFRSAAFSLSNFASLLMFLGMFGSIFLLAQFFQSVQGYSPVPVRPEDPPVDARADVHRSRRGRALRPHRPAEDPGDGPGPAGRGARLDRDRVDADHLVLGVDRAVHRRGGRDGAVLRPDGQRRVVRRPPAGRGQASGANNAIRELGGVFGVAVLAAIFAQAGGYQTPVTFTDGMNSAVYVGAAAVGVGSIAAFLMPRPRRAAEARATEVLAEAA